MKQTLNWRLLVIAFLISMTSGQARAADDPATLVVKDFIASWQTFDIDKIMSYVADDCYYANEPSLTGANPVLMGRIKMREFLAPFFVRDPLIVPFKFHTEIKDMIAGGGGVVIQRVDNFQIANGKFAVKVAGIFKVKDGKIVYWMDYFDGGAFGPISTLMSNLAKK